MSRTPRGAPQAVGVYRLWRDLGYAVGALLSGIVADLGLSWAIVTVGGLTFPSSIVVAIRMTNAPHAPQVRYELPGGR